MPFIETLKTSWQVLSEWFLVHWVLLATLSAVSFIASIIGCAVLITSLPPDYFKTKKRLRRIKNPVLRICLSSLKNLFGGMLIIVGILLSVPGVPGQGILTILTGLILSDFPGKKRLERRLVRLPAILSAANRIRSRFKRPPLGLEE